MTVSLQKRASKLASAGKTNAEIFGDLEITSSALSALLTVAPQVIFGILQGRASFIKGLVEKIRALGMGWDEQMGPRPHLPALQFLLERADKNNNALVAVYDLVLLANTSIPTDGSVRDPSTVTSLLRAVK